MMSEVGAGGMAVVIEPSHQYSIKLFCHEAGNRRGPV